MTLAGEAQEILVDMAVLGLFVFLFYDLSRGRRDRRLLFWMAGWLCVVVHFAVAVWVPESTAWQQVQACIGVDALLLAASCFIYSHAMRRLPARTTHAVAGRSYR